MATKREGWTPSGEIVVSAVIERIPFGPDGIGNPLEAAILAAGRYVAEAARYPGHPWEAEATFGYQGSTYTVRGTSDSDGSQPAD